MGPTRAAFTLLALAAPAAGWSQGGPDANTQATAYLEAFLHGKPAVAARLTHPTVLAKQNQALLKGFDDAAKAGTEREYLQALGKQTTQAELEAMSDVDCFVACVEGNQRLNAEAYKSMRKAKVKWLEGALLPDQRYQAAFRVESPSGKTTNLQRMVVLLEMTTSGWKVLGVSSQG